MFHDFGINGNWIGNKYIRVGLFLGQYDSVIFLKLFYMVVSIWWN